MVVEVALRVKHVILLRENSGYEFLGGSLTVGACHAYNPCAERETVLDLVAQPGGGWAVSFK